MAHRAQFQEKSWKYRRLGQLRNHTFVHAQLGKIRGCRVTYDLVQYRSLPYACVPRRFAHSELLDYLPDADGENSRYDATEYGPCSIQSLASIDVDVRWNQLPENPRREQCQGEDCLRLTLTTPSDGSAAALLVVVFLHGGALTIGSGIS